MTSNCFHHQSCDTVSEMTENTDQGLLTLSAEQLKDSENLTQNGILEYVVSAFPATY